MFGSYHHLHDFVENGRQGLNIFFLNDDSFLKLIMHINGSFSFFEKTMKNYEEKLKKGKAVLKTIVFEKVRRFVK